MEIIAVCSEIHTEHINTVWAERGIVNVKLVVHIMTTGLYSHCRSDTIRVCLAAGIREAYKAMRKLGNDVTLCDINRDITGVYSCVT